MKNVLKIGFIAFFLFAIPFTGTPLGDHWESLGVRKVDFKLDHDIIPVTYRKGAFSAIKIAVENGALNVHKCIIHFEKGGKQEVAIRHNFGPQSASRTIDLKGNKRLIESIEFWYDTKNPLARRATVQVFGKH